MSYPYIIGEITEAVIAAKEESRRRYIDAWNAYTGRHQDQLIVKAGIDDNIFVNLTRKCVDRGVSFLYGRGLTWIARDTGAAGPAIDTTGEEDFLNQVWGFTEPGPQGGEEEKYWQRNKGNSLLLKIGTNGAVCGHVFVKIVPDQAGGNLHRLIGLDPAYVDVQFDPNDIEHVVYYCIQYPLDQRYWYREEHTYDPETDNWLITTWHGDDGGLAGNKIEWTLIRTEPWEYPFAAIVDWQNLPMPNEFHGFPDITDDIIRLQDGINRVASNISKIVRIHAHPKIYTTGFVGRSTKSGDQSVDVSPDRTINLPTGATLGVISPVTDLSAAISHYEMLRDAMHELMDVPDIDSTAAAAGSAPALNVVYAPLKDRTNRKQGTHGDGLIELNRRLLIISGMVVPPVLDIWWPDTIPGDQLLQRNLAQIDMQLGVSSDTILRQLGYNPELERTKRETDQAQLERLQQLRKASPLATSGGAQGQDAAIPQQLPTD